MASDRPEDAGTDAVESDIDGDAERTAEVTDTEADPASDSIAEPATDASPETFADTAKDSPAEPAPVPPVVPAPAPKRGGGFVSGLAGGVAAAAVGFGAAQFLDVDWMGMRGGQDPVATQLEQQNTAISGQADAISALEARLSEISTAVANPDLSSMEETISTLAGKVENEVGSLSSGIVTQLGQVTQTLSGLSDTVSTVETRLDGVDGSLSSLDGGLKTVTEQLSSVDDRLVAVEKRPLTESSETAKSAFDAYEREVERLTAELESQQSESSETAKRMAELAALTEKQITAVQEEAAAQLAAMQSKAASEIDAKQAETDAKLKEAQSSVQTASVTASVVQLEKALEEGTPYADALASLGDGVQVPEALSASADTGVKTLMQLRDSYPEAARAALEASVKASSQDADPVGKITAFFRHQTGARSLAPKEGDDPDAVLSRAEAAVDTGDLTTALTEIGTLDEAGQAAMADWTSQANARVSAVSAAATLVASLPTN